MADIRRLENALMQADAAGNVDDARAFASEIRRMRAAGVTASKPSIDSGNGSSNVDDKPLEGSLLGGIAGGDKRVSAAGNEIFGRGGVIGGAIQGGRDIIDAGAQMLSHAVPESARKSIDQFNNYLADKTGLVGRMPDGGIDAKIKQDEVAYQGARKEAGRSGTDVARAIGGIVSTLPVSFIRGLQITGGKGIFDLANIGRAGAQGAIVGASQPVLSGDVNFFDEKLSQLGAGAAFGGASAPIGAALGKALSPSVRDDIKVLMDEGITPTPGQILGGKAQSFEDKAMSAPFVGEAIKEARMRGQADLNRAVYNRALLGTDEAGKGALLPIGREGAAAVKEAIDRKYRDLLPRMSFKSDPQFVSDLSELRSMASTGLAPREAQRFNALLDESMSKLSPNGGMTGETFKILESKLGKDASSFSSSSDAYQRELGGALKQAQSVFREAIERNNPQLSSELSDINRSYANYAVLRGAGNAASDMSSGFTPAKLAAAVRSADKSVGKGRTLTGQATMQDLSDPAVRVLSSKYPDSGTAGRGAFLGLGGAGLMGAAGGIPITGGDLGLAALLYATSTAPYSRAGQKMMANLLTKRPQSVRRAGGVAEKLVPLLSSKISTDNKGRE